jgi:hypothetical protein
VCVCVISCITLFYSHWGGGESILGPLGTSATEWRIVPALGDYDCGAVGGMKIGRGNRSTRRKPVPAPLCPPQIPLARPGLEPGPPATNRLSSVAACITRSNIWMISSLLPCKLLPLPGVVCRLFIAHHFCSYMLLNMWVCYLIYFIRTYVTACWM